jgi:hypothetical protein
MIELYKNSSIKNSPVADPSKVCNKSDFWPQDRKFPLIKELSIF